MKRIDTEFAKWLRLTLWFIYALSLMFLAHTWFNDYQMKKGVAVSQYLRENFKVVVSAEEARFLNVNVQHLDLVVKDCNIFQK